MGRRSRLLTTRLLDERSGRVVFLSHCLLNQNVRYLGGATRPGIVGEVVDDALRHHRGIHQMPCPEQLAWGGARKRYILPVYGSRETPWHAVVRPMIWLFMRYTEVRYRLLARRVGRRIRDYTRSGVRVDAVVGVAGSPSCGVHETLDLPGAAGCAAACPLLEIDPAVQHRDVILPNLVVGEGVFIRALRRHLRRHGEEVSFEEFDLLSSTEGPAEEGQPADGAHR